MEVSSFGKQRYGDGQYLCFPTLLTSIRTAGQSKRDPCALHNLSPGLWKLVLDSFSDRHDSMKRQDLLTLIANSSQQHETPKLG